jgi:hypothetical protein
MESAVCSVVVSLYSCWWTACSKHPNILITTCEHFEEWGWLVWLEMDV